MSFYLESNALLYYSDIHMGINSGEVSFSTKHIDFTHSLWHGFSSKTKLSDFLITFKFQKIFVFSIAKFSEHKLVIPESKI